jgi:hypothetical protein
MDKRISFDEDAKAGSRDRAAMAGPLLSAISVSQERRHEALESLASRYDMEMIKARAKSHTSDPETRSKRDAGHSASPRLVQKKGLKTDRQESHRSNKKSQKSTKRKKSKGPQLLRSRSKECCSIKDDSHRDGSRNSTQKKPKTGGANTKSRKVCAVRNSITPDEQQLNFDGDY